MSRFEPPPEPSPQGNEPVDADFGAGGARVGKSRDRETNLPTEDGLRRPSVSSSDTGDLEWQPGDSPGIGAFRILRVLGEGGMGVVFLAEQTSPIERRVALKVVKHGGPSSNLRARFEAERQALARLSHPGVGQVYEAGDMEDGSPYFAMELIEGPRLTQYCDRERLTIEERLELFRQVCDAVHHVHQKGVVHRDLKDDNILVAASPTALGRPQPKLIDFGIARTLDHSEAAERLTRVGAFVGTPAYLSPELLVGHGIDDLRIDVYALGVLLFKLLVGEVPFEQGSSSVMALFRRIADEDAPLPSNRVAELEPEDRTERATTRRLRPAWWQRRLRGDLDAIVAKAMAKDPDERYGSAAEFSADLERYLSHEPIRAKTAGRLLRATKFVRRYRGAVAAVAAVLLVLAGGLWARSLEAARANREAAVAREVSEFLVELFEVSDPGRSLGEDVTARQLLDRGSERIRLELTDQPLTRARLLDTIGVVYERLGLLSAAEEHLRESVALRRQELGDDDPEVLESLGHLGQALWSQGRHATAEPILRQAVDGWRHLDARRQLGLALGRLGMLYDVQQNFERAEAPLREALEIMLDHGKPLDVAAAYDDLAVLESDRGRPEEAEVLFRHALDLRESALGLRRS